MAIDRYKMIYIDTNILIYLLEGHEYYAKRVADLLQELTTHGESLVTSAVTVTEFLAGTDSSNLQTLQQIPRLQIVTLDSILAERAANMQRKHGTLQIGDAIHLATALQYETTLFFTNDKLLAKVASEYVKIQSAGDN